MDRSSRFDLSKSSQSFRTMDVQTKDCRSRKSMECYHGSSEWRNLCEISGEEENVQEHFKLLLDKFKAKRKHQAKLSGVDIEDSEMDILMEEITEKWEEAEASDLGCSSKEKAD